MYGVRYVRHWYVAITQRGMRSPGLILSRSWSCKADILADEFMFNAKIYYVISSPTPPSKRPSERLFLPTSMGFAGLFYFVHTIPHGL